MTDEKKTLFNKLESINEEAHNYAYNLWEEAGKLEDEHGYTDEVEEKKILASDEQASSFKEIFEKELSIDQKKLFWKLVKNADQDPDKGLIEQYLGWYCNNSERMKICSIKEMSTLATNKYFAELFQIENFNYLKD